MNIAITSSCGQKFSLLTDQLHDLIIWENSDKTYLLYSINKETTIKIKEVSDQLGLKLASDKFANDESFNAIFSSSKYPDELTQILKNHFKSGIERVPNHNFPEKMSPSVHF